MLQVILCRNRFLKILNLPCLTLFDPGCFWGAERRFWQQEGVWSTAAGYAGGYTDNPTYEEVCSGQTGHNEAVSVAYDSNIIGFSALLQVFRESHDPTQGMRQGNDSGTQYRSGIYCMNDAQYEQAIASRDSYQSQLTACGLEIITTEIIGAEKLYFAEDYHQQNLAKNPNGYCGLGGTNASCVAEEKSIPESNYSATNDAKWQSFRLYSTVSGKI